MVDIHGGSEPIAATDSDLSGSIFPRCGRQGVAFEYVAMSSAGFQNNVDLSGATFRDADLSALEISDCKRDSLRIDDILLTDLLTAYRKNL